ncbi:unnamed protein product [Nyctereutes procyonoides]|uniref:(raccoon dog) hypothetical protein n=1 Tax=Nyctereutes procyonoides TaxID=34880 RepID=A0A811ZXX7_NYCPR|nr:unnamed protein product [Nyctereutes procyonoides]
MSPPDHHSDRPPRPPYTPPSDSGGGYVARRSPGEPPRAGCSDSSRSLPPPSDKPQASEAGEPREHGRPAPSAAAPSYCFTPAERAGEPPGTASANHASPSRVGPNLLAFLAEHAQSAAALTYARAQKAGEPEPA